MSGTFNTQHGTIDSTTGAFTWTGIDIEDGFCGSELQGTVSSPVRRSRSSRRRPVRARAARARAAYRRDRSPAARARAVTVSSIPARNAMTGIWG
jgi:hypothetical protein